MCIRDSFVAPPLNAWRKSTVIRYPKSVARRPVVQIACFCVIAVLIGTPQTLPPLLPPAANFSFPAKQTLTYAVDWRVFPAGTATFHLEQVGGMQHVVATGESVGAVNLLFRVNDRFESYFNRTTGCSTSFAKQLQEGRRQLNSTLRFNSSDGKQVLEEKNLVTGTLSLIHI